MFLLPKPPQQLTMLFNICAPKYCPTYLKYNNDVILIIIVNGSPVIILTILSNFIQYRIATVQFINSPAIAITKQFHGIEFNLLVLI